MLNTRQLDLAVLFDTDPARRWSVTPLLEEKLFLIRSRHGLPARTPARMKMAQLAGLPLILPSGPHGLRSTLDAAFARARVTPTLLTEIDSLAMLMDAVDAGLGCTLQPWAALGRFPDAQQRFHLAEIVDAKTRRLNSLCSLSARLSAAPWRRGGGWRTWRARWCRKALGPRLQPSRFVMAA